ncbi:hypothetical protein QTO34_017623 [Cnephaeus nilssonii]|uniref:Uncharacterized protein n=1 Tax=Cnephaeus nilssonii TaxID=3371016 RepID=A0AA40LQ12_CNENI|nr:hypothetical protein QTO34_017623 [Eptesicus nilssonii]
MTLHGCPILWPLTYATRKYSQIKSLHKWEKSCSMCLRLSIRQLFQKTRERQKAVEIKIHEKCEPKSREQTPEDYDGGSSGRIGVGDLEGVRPEGSGR